MKSLFLLIDEANVKLSKASPDFLERVELMLGMLRSVQAVPYRRSKLNGHVHRLLSATLVHAFDTNETIRITTRMFARFHDMGVSTKFIEYLDKCVQEKLLKSDLSSDRAEGNLTFTDTSANWLSSASEHLNSSKSADISNRSIDSMSYILTSPVQL